MRGGFTLPEVVVATVVLEVGILGSLGMLVLAAHALAEAEGLERALAVAEAVADSLGSAPGAGAGSRAAGRGHVAWSAPEEGPFDVRYVVDGEVRFRVLGVRGRRGSVPPGPP